MQNRYYDPATAQFVSIDPMVAITQSPYGYVDNNPLNGTDPSGLCWPSWSCGVENYVSNNIASATQVASVVLGAAQNVDDGVIVVCLFFCQEAVPVLIGASAGLGVAATLTSCLAGDLGASADGCANSLQTEGFSYGLESYPGLEALNDLYTYSVGSGAADAAVVCRRL